MECMYITSKFEKKSFDLVISHLGEAAGIKENEMKYVDLSNKSIISEELWLIICKEERAILDLRNIDMEILITLYLRFIKWSHRTFLLLNLNQEEEFQWGYGAGLCEIKEDGSINSNQLKRLQRDIAFFFVQDREESQEPVRQFIEKYWRSDLLKKIDCSGGINFDLIEKQEKNIGEEIISNLKECTAKKNIDKFKDELKKVSDNEYITAAEFIRIGLLCRDANLFYSRVAILKKGNEIWKFKNIDLIFALIDAYVDSPNIKHRMEGVELVNKIFKISYSDNNLIWNVKDVSKLITKNHLKSLFNSYISIDNYEELYKISQYEKEIIRETGGLELQQLFLRNKAICLGQMGEYKAALKLYIELYESDPTENTLQLIIFSCDKICKYIQELNLLVALLLIHFGDLNYIEQITGIMSSENYIFEKHNGWKKVEHIGEIPGKQIIPLVVSALSLENNQRGIDSFFTVSRIVKEIDKNCWGYLLENKNNLAYLWDSFKTDWGDKYDFELVNFIFDYYEKSKDNNLLLDEYIRDTLAGI